MCPKCIANGKSHFPLRLFRFAMFHSQNLNVSTIKQQHIFLPSTFLIVQRYSIQTVHRSVFILKFHLQRTQASFLEKQPAHSLYYYRRKLTQQEISLFLISRKYDTEIFELPSELS